MTSLSSSDSEIDDNTPEKSGALALPGPGSEGRLDQGGGLGGLAPGTHVGKLSDVGRERERNEDSLYVFNTFMQYDLGQEQFGLYLIADGMGGHQKGELASSLAVRVSARTILEEIYLPDLVQDRNTNNRPLNEILVEAVQNANAAVQGAVSGGGTTLTLALVMGNTAYIAHVGDTRAYVFKQNELKQITQDHSFSHRLKELGETTAEELAQFQNVLYKAIGQTELAAKDIDTYVQHLPPGASLLLCSDGLWGLVTEEHIEGILATAPTPQHACEQLVTVANENGGRDNITAVIVSMGTEVEN